MALKKRGGHNWTFRSPLMTQSDNPEVFVYGSAFG
ncbi:hypothetical protein V1283_008688 [Bradyrhizobium sp. AZCC 2262]